MLLVMPRSFSSGALSIWSKGTNWTFGFAACRTFVIAAVRVVLPWSMCPMVPMFMCSLVRSNLALAIGQLLYMRSRTRLPSADAPTHTGYDLFRDVRGNRLIPRELHRVGGSALSR